MSSSSKISHRFGWYYFLAATLYLLFVVFIAASTYGTHQARPRALQARVYDLFTWASMLFAAGIGIDLMFFSVSEPVSHYLAPPRASRETVEAAREATVWTLFHYGITGWGMYALMGMALGYFSYRSSCRSPSAPRCTRSSASASTGPIGDASTSPPCSAPSSASPRHPRHRRRPAQLRAELHLRHPRGTRRQIALIVLAVVMATVSAVSGVDKGIRGCRSSTCCWPPCLMFFVLVTGKHPFLLNAIVQNVGDYVSRFPVMTLDTFAYDQPPMDRRVDAVLLGLVDRLGAVRRPVPGPHLPRPHHPPVRRGDDDHPVLLHRLWISIFGNAALDLITTGNTEFGETP